MAAVPEEEMAISLAPRFEVQPGEIAGRMRELQAFVKQYLVPGEDYGVIPGTKKPTLLKPGAEKLCDVYGFTREFHVEQAAEDWEHGRFAYTVKATLRSMRTTLVIAEGLGECNSYESRYRYLWVKENRVPRDQRDELQSRATKYGLQYRVVNDDPFSQVNTYLKMAKKRALVDAVLSATRSSGLFTQDLEDLQANGVLGDDGLTVDQDGGVVDTRAGSASRAEKKPEPKGALNAALRAVGASYTAAREAGFANDAIAEAVAAATPRPRAEWTVADAQAAQAALERLLDRPLTDAEGTAPANSTDEVPF